MICLSFKGWNWCYWPNWSCWSSWRSCKSFCVIFSEICASLKYRFLLSPYNQFYFFSSQTFFFSLKGDRGEVGPPGPAGFAGPPVSRATVVSSMNKYGCWIIAASLENGFPPISSDNWFIIHHNLVNQSYVIGHRSVLHNWKEMMKIVNEYYSLKFIEHK